jgi:ribosomal protein L25 (general stress protein Ctc)
MNRVVDSPSGARIGCFFGALVFGIGGLLNLRVAITAMKTHAIVFGRDSKLIEVAQDPTAFDQALHQQWFSIAFLLDISATFLYFAKKLES